MATRMDDEISVVDTHELLREFVKEPPPAIANKAITAVDPQSRLFIEASPFFLLATTDSSDGSLDVSPRGDPPGSVLIVNEGRTLVFGDRKGNRRLDSLRNILNHPQVAMLFMVPGSNDTLRVNGTATILSSAPYFEQLKIQGKRPDLAVTVDIDELYLHCAKAFLRSQLWQTETWPAAGTVPSAGRIAKSQTGSKTPETVFNTALKLESRFRKY